MNLYPELVEYIRQFTPDRISDERKKVLEPLIAYIREVRKEGRVVQLHFICTHNSRRSQLAQLWAQLAAKAHQVEATTFSGGVEVTAFNERAVAAIQRAGFRVAAHGETNLEYVVSYAEEEKPLKMYSTLYDAPENPVKDFAAVMTCTHADENCPFIPGASERIPVRYDDPKAFDGTDQETEKYDERSAQIGNEMFYVFEMVAK